MQMELEMAMPPRSSKFNPLIYSAVKKLNSITQMSPSIRSLVVASTLSFVIDVDGRSSATASYVVAPRFRRVVVVPPPPPRGEIRPPRRHCRRSGDATSTAATATTTDDDDDLHRPYVRILKRGRHYDVQTAISTFRKNVAASSSDDDAVPEIVSAIVDLHAQIHFGDASYYRYYDDDAAFGSRYDRVLYELIVEDRFLEPATTTSIIPANGNIPRRLIPVTSPTDQKAGGGGGSANPIGPTQADRNTASQYGLQCQVDGMPYTRDGWIHADLTREEFMSYLNRDAAGIEREEGRRHHRRTRRRKRKRHQQQRQPLWALASASSTTYPGSELVHSLLRPLTTTTATSTSADGTSALTRRLFTHLFLPGDSLSGWIRAVLWLGVPSPELSIMLVDWSSLSHVSRRSRRRRSSRRVVGGTADGGGGDDGIAPISPIAAPVLLSLMSGRWGTARRLVFGQVLASGQTNADASRNGVLIDRRNDRAMGVLRASMSSLSTTSFTPGREVDPVSGVDDPALVRGTSRIALLYGAAHCRDLHDRLVRTEGMTHVRTEWRTAFRATAPRWGDVANVDGWMRSRSRDVVSSLPPSMDMSGVVESMSVSTLESVAVGLVVLPLYMLVGGFDWVSTIGDAENSLRGGMYLDGIAAVLLYLMRHVAMYVGIAKFVVDWGRNGDGIFDDEDSS